MCCVCRFGTQVSGVQPCKRQMRINNHGPFGEYTYGHQSAGLAGAFVLQIFAWTGRCFCVVDIRLDWQVFNEEKETDQLLDCIVTYGQLFPLKNAGGDEVVPKLPGKFFIHFFYHEFIIIDRT